MEFLGNAEKISYLISNPELSEFEKYTKTKRECYLRTSRVWKEIFSVKYGEYLEYFDGDLTKREIWYGGRRISQEFF